MATTLIIGSTTAGAQTSTPTTSPSSSSNCAMPQSGYGRMFPNLPAASWGFDSIDALGQAAVAEQEPATAGPDPEDNPGIPAGYTYFGQFVDHDITLDARPDDLVTPTDPSSLVNGRTPQLDLDSLYGQGPDTATTLYQADKMHLVEGNLLTGSPDQGARDLPRQANGQAIIGDPRNDENRLVAGIHSLFIRFHNRTVDAIVSKNPTWTSSQVFQAARQQVTWNYQWLIVTDYLPRIAGQDKVAQVIRPQGANAPSAFKATTSFYNPCQQMPVEFSVAAYRFGHSQVRANYRINSQSGNLPVFSGTWDPTKDLTGFQPAPSNFGIDWNLLVQNPASRTPVQPSYKVDGSLTFSLGLLPLPATGAGPANLAERNLLRSRQLGLPSGQDVARQMGLTPLRDDQIIVGQASGDPADTKSLTSISSEFANKAPLWSYILAEAVNQSYVVQDGHIVATRRTSGPVGTRLGPVGARIVAETFAGLLQSDPNSIFNNRFSPTRSFDLRALVNTAQGTTPVQLPTPPRPVTPTPRPTTPTTKPAPQPRR